MSCKPNPTNEADAVIPTPAELRRPTGSGRPATEMLTLAAKGQRPLMFAEIAMRRGTRR